MGLLGKLFDAFQPVVADRARSVQMDAPKVSPVSAISAAAHSASAQGEAVSVATIVNRLLKQLCNDSLYPDICAGLIQRVAP